MAKPWKSKSKANTKKNCCNRCDHVFCDNYDILSPQGCVIGRNFRNCEDRHVRTVKWV